MLLKTCSTIIFHRNILKFGQQSLKTRAMATLPEVVAKLSEFAPENLAEKWDNVGLLVEPKNNKR